MALNRKRIIEMLKEGYSYSEICATLRCSRRDVAQLARKLNDIDIGEDALAKLIESELRQLVTQRDEREDNYVKPDLDYICRELEKPKVTRKLLWYEYGNTTVPDGMQLYQYSQFCKLIESRHAVEGAAMLIKHDAGRCAFIDWALPVLTGKLQSKKHRFPGLWVRRIIAFELMRCSSKSLQNCAYP